MIKRLRTFVAREQLKDPNKSGIQLVVNRLIEILNVNISTKLMHLKKDSTFTSPEHMFMCSLFPQKMLDLIIRDLQPKSVLDVGCGTAVSLRYFIHNRVDAWGVENSTLAIKQSGVKEKIIRHNLNKELNLEKQFDLVWSFEVIEHIHPDYEGKFLKTLTNHAPVIILSAARKGQGGHGHFNEQDPEYWIQKFDELGYGFDSFFSKKLRASGDILCENILCFRQIQKA